jgi:hypothetical protein
MDSAINTLKIGNSLRNMFFLLQKFFGFTLLAYFVQQLNEYKPLSGTTSLFHFLQRCGIDLAKLKALRYIIGESFFYRKHPNQILYSFYTSPVILLKLEKPSLTTSLA